VILVEILYVTSAIVLALMGFHSLVLSTIYIVHRNDKIQPPPNISTPDLPTVVVQLPVFNEKHVIERLIESVSRLDYPYHKLRIQVLDDSTDETLSSAAAAIEKARATGLQIEHIRRRSRQGFKAGALTYGLQRTEAELIAVFDADFVPQPDFLHRVVPYFGMDDRLGLIQTRWGHLNADLNSMTRAQALALDAHFIVEQLARHRAGLLVNFSGTAGVWRRACIEQSGGWHSDTLSEDIDLSYRAQLAGWRCLYLPDVSTPAEIPAMMMGFKRQQSRWATGTMQCLRKLGGVVLCAPLTVWQKIEAMFHLSGYVIHPLMLLVLFLVGPLMLSGRLSDLPLAGLGLAMLGMPVEILLSQRRLYSDWLRRMAAFPILMLIGIGIAASNTRAVLRAFSAHPQAFERTPKFHLQEGNPDYGRNSSYALPIDSTTWVELALAAYATIMALLALRYAPSLVPFMMLYALGFAYVAGVSLQQARPGRDHSPRSSRQWGLLGSGIGRGSSTSR